MHRLKEHIYRNHRRPDDLCTRCWKAFKTPDELCDHHAEPCEARPDFKLDGISAVQEREIKKRTGLQKLTEEEQWRKMYRIIFPRDSKIPNPYTRSSTQSIDKDKARDFLSHQLPNLLREGLPAILSNQSNQSQADSVEQILALIRNPVRRFLSESSSNSGDSDPQTRTGGPSGGLTEEWQTGGSTLTENVRGVGGASANDGFKVSSCPKGGPTADQSLSGLGMGDDSEGTLGIILDDAHYPSAYPTGTTGPFTRDMDSEPAPYLWGESLWNEQIVLDILPLLQDIQEDNALGGQGR
ncbi:hypothetical protein B0J13DRAFT_291770 [Dactylonectria estremocensis]|uniref:C2H2-type domain-containing protein n=1 Tax=Dactylonectria estremocensis TaxID=1079267 RepID=A0A9P9I849_9HYPO|nr:hypothetical protein B0J13DRAFT_291770 [Dactylonectria estremocensis]